jgi:4-amino-4-deoxy-L-arabinose transferase-like glycosyltransferase
MLQPTKHPPQTRLWSRQSWINTAVFTLLAAGAFLRFAALDRYPLPAHQDELSEIYDSYSILRTGADRTGTVHPLILRGMGENDYRSAMYAWIATVPLHFNGFSVASGRLPSAVLGVTSLLLIYLFARRLAGDTYALIALAFATFSPWHIAFSRLAHHGAMLPAFFLILVFWLWQRASASGYSLPSATLLGLAVGASANAYFAFRLIGPLLGLVILWDVARHAMSPMRRGLAIAGGALLGALPQLVVLVEDTAHFFSRARVTLLDPTNPMAFVGSVTRNIGGILAPRFLFWPAMVDTGLTPARLLPIEVIFFYLGLLTFWKLRVREGSRFKGHVYLGLLISFLPAILTSQPHSIRESASLTLLPLFSAAGVIELSERLARWRLIRRLYLPTVVTLIAASFCFVAYMYIFSRWASGQRSNNALVQVGTKLRYYGPKYDRVFITDSASHPDLYVVVFSGMLPEAYQRAPKVFENRKGWDVARQIGKFYFLSGPELKEQERVSTAAHSNDLFVTRDRLNGALTIDSASWGDAMSRNADKFYFADTAHGTRPRS